MSNVADILMGLSRSQGELHTKVDNLTKITCDNTARLNSLELDRAKLVGKGSILAVIGLAVIKAFTFMFH